MIASVLTAIIIIAALYFYQHMGRYVIFGATVPDLLSKIAVYMLTFVVGSLGTGVLVGSIGKFAGAPGGGIPEGGQILDHFLGFVFGITRWALIVIGISLFFYMVPLQKVTTQTKQSFYMANAVAFGNAFYARISPFFGREHDKDDILAQIQRDKRQFTRQMRFGVH